MIGYLKQYPNILLVVQGKTDTTIWFHGLNDVWLLSDFTEMKAQPCLNTIRPTISNEDILKIFGAK